VAKLQHGRLAWLDALRGWAVLGVVMVHSGQAAHSTGIIEKISAAGQYGVQLFFLVSALTISMTYNSHVLEFGTSVRSQIAWFTKRFFRIAPLYYFAALFYPIEQYGVFVLSHRRYGSIVHVTDIIANLLFIHTWVPSANNSVVPGGWSIGVEMFFYALVPFCWLLLPIRRRIKLLGVGAIAFLAITELVCKMSTGSYYVADNSYFYYWFPTEAPVLILGLMFYFLYGSRLHESLSPRLSMSCFGGFLISLVVGLYVGIWKEIAPVAAPAILVVSFILLILSLHGWLKYIVVNKFAIFLGKISFSVYIFHFVVLDFIRVLFQVFRYVPSGPLTLLGVLVSTVVLTCGIGLLSKRIIEDPAIRYGHLLSRSIASKGAEVQS